MKNNVIVVKLTDGERETIESAAKLMRQSRPQYLLYTAIEYAGKIGEIKQNDQG